MICRCAFDLRPLLSHYNKRVKTMNKEWITTAELIAYLRLILTTRRNADFTWTIVLALLITGIGTLRNERLCIRATGPSRQSAKAKSKNGTATANGRLSNEPRCNYGVAPRKGASPTRTA